jgi:hypothetical protein
MLLRLYSERLCGNIAHAAFCFSEVGRYGRPDDVLPNLISSSLRGRYPLAVFLETSWVRWRWDKKKLARCGFDYREPYRGLVRVAPIEDVDSLARFLSSRDPGTRHAVTMLARTGESEDLLSESIKEFLAEKKPPAVQVVGNMVSISPTLAASYFDELFWEVLDSEESVSELQGRLVLCAEQSGLRWSWADELREFGGEAGPRFARAQ